MMADKIDDGRSRRDGHADELRRFAEDLKSWKIDDAVRRRLYGETSQLSDLGCCVALTIKRIMEDGE
jgi:hypothetical protein